MVVCGLNEITQVSMALGSLQALNEWGHLFQGEETPLLPSYLSRSPFCFQEAAQGDQLDYSALSTAERTSQASIKALAHCPNMRSLRLPLVKGSDGRAAEHLESWGLPGWGQRGGIQSALTLASGWRGRASPGLEPEACFPTVELEVTPRPPRPQCVSPWLLVTPPFLWSPGKCGAGGARC